MYVRNILIQYKVGSMYGIHVHIYNIIYVHSTGGGLYAISVHMVYEGGSYSHIIDIFIGASEAMPLDLFWVVQNQKCSYNVISMHSVCDLLSLCLDVTYLAFEGKFYQWVHGAAMGSLTRQ